VVRRKKKNKRNEKSSELQKNFFFSKFPNNFEKLSNIPFFLFFIPTIHRSSDLFQRPPENNQPRKEI
jgi:hypothetical protein